MQQENRLCAITSGTTLTLLAVQQVPNVIFYVKFLTVSPGKLTVFHLCIVGIRIFTTIFKTACNWTTASATPELPGSKLRQDTKYPVFL